MDLTHQLASDLRETLDKAGITGHAAEAVLKETAHIRHKWRVSRAAQAALAWVHEHLTSEAHLAPKHAIMLCMVDVFGVGGWCDCTGHGTDRVRPFRYLGKGRKQASDGAAWSAAIRHAADELAQESGIVPLGWYCTASEIGVQFRNRSSVGETPPVAWSIDFFVQRKLLPWARAIARLGLRQSLGYPHRLDYACDAPLAITAEAETQPKDWADVLNAVEEAILDEKHQL